ncbi:MAG: Nudix family hydrolase [Methylotenera sp.]|uniref:Nudix family hydrolase n=1 Tax=Methylotenera sp. TaxID=2051956 RepID=UPI00182CA9FB|nr:Nudix family hydrolase [Methylotenera sp.]NOU25574.1 Nudix family hydrolase [Methylotenera sp.]
MNKLNVTHAAVGVIQRGDGAVLLGERPIGKPWAGYWEFPGGKVEVNETPIQALVRELREELGITVKSHSPWLTRTFDYPEKLDAKGRLESAAKIVKLHFFIVTQWDGEPQGLENQTLSWQTPEKLTVSPMLPANAPILSALGLPQVYAITNLHELGETMFFARLKTALNGGLRMMQIREKQLSAEDFLEFSRKVISMAEPYGAKVFLNSANLLEESTLLSLGATGLHLTSNDLMRAQQKPANILCGASCHNRQDLAQAEILGLDYVLLSPVHATQSHAEVTPLGWKNFAKLIQGYSLPVYALGGMQLADLHEAKQNGAHGVAMLRGVWR